MTVLNSPPSCHIARAKIDTIALGIVRVFVEIDALSPAVAVALNMHPARRRRKQRPSKYPLVTTVTTA
jgi:hypothetical protein